MCCDLTARSTAPRRSGSPSGVTAGACDGDLLDRPLERQAVLVHRRHVLGIGVAEQHRAAVADEPRADGAADRPGAHEDVVEAFRRCLSEACQRGGLWGATQSCRDGSRLVYNTLTPLSPRSEGVNVKRRTALVSLLILAVAVVAATAALAARTGHASASADTPKRGGSITIARIEDSQSFDKTNVFQNESIWLAEQIMEPLYTVTADGKGVKPWLATSYTKSADGKTYTFKLRKGVKFSNGSPMTSADVKFSIDDARAQAKGWGYLDGAIKNITTPDPGHGGLPPEVQLGAVRRRHRAVRERDHPEELRRAEARGLLQAPDRHRAVHVGQARGRPVGDAEAQPDLLAEGQAVSRLRHLDVRDRREHARAAAAAAARSRSTSSRRSTRSRSCRTRRASR